MQRQVRQRRLALQLHRAISTVPNANATNYIRMQLELAPSFSASMDAKILPNARAAGDLDGDGATELVFGSVTGAIAVFKAQITGDELVLWRTCTLDGSVSSICMYQRPESKETTAMMRVVVVTSEGKCYVFQDLDTEETFAPFAEFNVALNASAVTVIGDELVVGTRDGRILIFDLGDAKTGEYKQLARFEIAAEIESMRPFAAPFVRSSGSSVLLIWCTSGEIFCYTPKGDAEDAGIEGLENKSSGNVTLWNGMSGEKEDLEKMIDAISVNGVAGHVAHVLMGEKVTLMSPLLEKLWEIRLPEAIVSLDKMRLPSLSSVGQETDALAACTWSGQVWVMKNSETSVCFRAMLPASSMFTTTIIKDDGRVEPIIVVVATSGVVFIFAEISDTIARAFASSTLLDNINQSPLITLLNSEAKRTDLLGRLTRNSFGPTFPLGDASVSIEDVVRAAMNYPLLDKTS